MLKRGRSGQQGISLVELLVGIAVGLFVVAGAALLVGNQLANNRKLLLETQLHQDLRATADIITRELRRAGYNTAAANFVWPKTTEEPNAYRIVNVPNPGEATFQYNRTALEAGPYGFRLDTTNNVIRTQLATAGWQELTDPRTLKVTAFTITDLGTPPTIVPCPDLCADGTTDCWPRMRVRDYRIDISAQAPSDANVQRSLSTNVRLRNDLIEYSDAANPNWICPKK